MTEEEIVLAYRAKLDAEWAKLALEWVKLDEARAELRASVAMVKEMKRVYECLIISPILTNPNGGLQA